MIHGPWSALIVRLLRSGHIDFLCPGRDPGTIDRATQKMKVAPFVSGRSAILHLQCLCYRVNCNNL